MGGIDKSKSLKKKNPKIQRLTEIDFQRLKISIRRVRYSLRAGSYLEPACKLYINCSAELFCPTSVEIYPVNQSR